MEYRQNLDDLAAVENLGGKAGLSPLLFGCLILGASP
jgi:hypothetical protein